MGGSYLKLVSINVAACLAIVISSCCADKSGLGRKLVRAQTSIEILQSRDTLWHYNLDTLKLLAGRLKFDSVTVMVQPRISTEVDVRSSFRYDKKLNLEIKTQDLLSGNALIDQQVASEINTIMDAFVKAVDCNTETNSFASAYVPGYFESRLLTAFKDDDLESYSFYVYYYACGAPHGFNQFLTFNFDRKTGKRIYFEDYLEIEMPEDSSYIFHLLETSSQTRFDNYPNIRSIKFAALEGELLILFDDYEVTSYSIGAPQVLIPKKYVNKMIRNRWKN